MKNKKEKFLLPIAYQLLVDQLADFIELRFGVYLDTTMGFQNNLEKFIRGQYQMAQLNKLSIEEIDKTHLIRGDGPPSPDLKECRKREIHRMTQADFKKNNSPNGVNYDFAIENCLSDIFNYWNAIKEKLGFLDVDDDAIFPITSYMRKLRNRVQHDLYPDRTAVNGPISVGQVSSAYVFPTFQTDQPIRLTEEDIKALVFEVRSQLRNHLIPYINKFLSMMPLPTT